MSMFPAAPVSLLLQIHYLSWKCCVFLSVTSSESSAWSPAGVQGTSEQNCSCILQSAPAPLWWPCWCPTGSTEKRRMRVEGRDALLQVRRARSSWSSCIWIVCFGTISSPGEQGKGKKWNTDTHLTFIQLIHVIRRFPTQWGVKVTPDEALQIWQHFCFNYDRGYGQCFKPQDNQNAPFTDLWCVFKLLISDVQ